MEATITGTPCKMELRAGYRSYLTQRKDAAETASCLKRFMPPSQKIERVQKFQKEFFKRSKESTQCVHRWEYGICQHLPDLAGNLPAGSYHCTGTMDPDSDPSKTWVLKHLCVEIIECLSSRALSADLCRSPVLCSFLLICVKCLSHFAHFRCPCRFHRMSQLPCSFLLICVGCLSSRA